MVYPVERLYAEDWELEYLEDWMLSPVALLASENRSASASLMPPLSAINKRYQHFISMYIKADNNFDWILGKKISQDIQVNVQRFISDAEAMFYLETPAFLFLSPPSQPLTFFCIYQNLPALSPEIPLDFHNSPPLLALGLFQWSPF